MDQRQRIALQRAKVQEALGLLKSVAELFGVETGAVAGDLSELDEWHGKVSEFEKWVFDSSPIA